MDAARRTTARWAVLARQRGIAIVTVAAIAAFLATRLINLDADVPDWTLSQYSPIDEFAYTVPALNLVDYGTWVHQAAPWAPVEGLPVNIAQNVVAATTLRSIGDDYVGLRASSVVFGLIAFLALGAIVRRQVAIAQLLDGVSSWLGRAVIGGAGVLLLADFSSVVSARVVEPTVTRLAATSVVLFLVSRGTLLGERQGVIRSGVFGATVGAAVLFVYIYNLFLLPAALTALMWWGYRHGGTTPAVRHAAAFLAGTLIVAVAYFTWVYALYHQTPLEWYRVWIGSFGSSARATGASVGKAISMLDANVFRLDPALLGLFLAGLPVFVWGLVRRPTAFGVLVGVGLGFFALQSAFVADYPARKFLAILLFAVPIVASGLLGLRSFKDWTLERPRRAIAAGAWLAAALLVTVLELPIHPLPPHPARLAMIVMMAGVTAVVAIALIAVFRRRLVLVVGAGALSLSVLAPLLYADATFVYLHPTFTYRDAQIRLGPTIDGQVTAGGWSFGMQLYNSSRPVLSAYFYGISRSEYERDVVRIFAEGHATSMFDYADSSTRSHWESLGFHVVETYAIILPRGQVLGRYVYGPGVSSSGMRP